MANGNGMPDSRDLQAATAGGPGNGMVFNSLTRMDVKRDPLSTGIAVVIHALVIGLIAYYVLHHVITLVQKPVAVVTLEAPPPPPLKVPPKAVLAGGGGGQKGPTPVSKGNPPKFDPVQLNPPKAPPTVAPKINIPVTVDVQRDLKMAKVDVPNLGLPSSPLVGTSLGNGNGTGIGSGNGSGLGPGSGGNIGGGVRRVGGGVSQPVVLFEPEPQFSEEARKAKVAGNVLVSMVVGVDGHTSNIKVLRGIGLGLDEKAREAAAQYKFRPAMENGKPVPVIINLEVTFTIY